MLRERILVSLILIPLAGLAVALGGLFYTAIIATLLGICAWEYWRLVRSGGYNTSMILLVSSVVGIIVFRQIWGFAGSAFAASVALLAMMAYHTFAYQRGEEGSATHFTMAVGGMFYMGWLGSYLISLRNLPDGDLWVFTGLTAAWFADAGAYAIGSRFGRHKMAPRLSPKKTWEGYLGGLLTSVVINGLFAWIWSLRAPQFTPWIGALLGLIIGAIAPIGDLGVSMFKRQFGVKDTSQLLPGHGGMLDRLDSTLWAGVLSYYIISLFLI